MAEPQSPTIPDEPPGEEAPTNVGIATMREDGTIEMMLRTVARGGAIGEALMEVAPGDERYAGMLKHLGGLAPGEAKGIPPFP